MKAIVCDEFAPVEELKYREVDSPSPGAGEVLVAVDAIGVNYPDGLLVQGKYQARPERPFTPGAEFAGRIVALGDGVDSFFEGQEVIGLSQNYGAYAEQIVVPANRLIVKPSGMGAKEAACLVLAHGTSHYALKQRGDLKAGETLLVLGAAGGTGLAAVQIGKAMGARVIAAASSDAKLAIAKDNGADEVVNYRESDLKSEIKRLTDGKGVDVVYDPVGGEAFDACSRSMAINGRILVVGFASGKIPSLPINLTLVKEYSLVGVFWGPWTRRDPAGFEANMQELFSWYKQGFVRIHIDETIPLANAGKALEKVLTRKVIGKIVLQPETSQT